jgi:hypothetical protein
VKDKKGKFKFKRQKKANKDKKGKKDKKGSFVDALYKVLSLYSKFQPSRCRNEKKSLTDGRTDRRTTALNQ